MNGYRGGGWAPVIAMLLLFAAIAVGLAIEGAP